MLTLKALKESDSGVVSAIHTEGVFFERLQGMGVCPGNRVTIVRYGSPIVIEVCGGRVALAQELAALIELTASEGADAS